jgi:C-terminal peptidase prc
MEKLTGEGMTSLIIDLRNNTGGLLEAAQEVADCFIEKGPIVEVDYRNARPAVLHADPRSKKYRLPIVVLINGNSASASEVLAAALRDYELATLVGEQTFGKGVVQEVVPMEREVVSTADAQGTLLRQERVRSALGMTIGKYYTPKRGEIHRQGLTPDVYNNIQNQLQDDPKLRELQKKIEAKAEELRKVRAEVNEYMRARDAQKEKAAEVARTLARGQKVQAVAKLAEPEKDKSPEMLGARAIPILPGAEAEGDGNGTGSN